MVNLHNLIQRDLKHVWHPGSQMKDFADCPPLVIEKAQGSYLYTSDGPLIDAISSWWCKSLGHGHKAVLRAIQEQMGRFEHVIGANTTHPLLVELAEELAQITGNQHVFFASDGAMAVEIAMKLALQAASIKGLGHKTQFMALKNAYHGESFGTLGVSDLGIYKAPYQALTQDCPIIEHIPYVSDVTDPLWNNCESYWNVVKPQLEAHKDSLCAIIVEPIIQGSGGLLCYSQDFLARLTLWAQANEIYVIADEIMTGIGRTGKWLASEYAGIKPDLICLSKGLTSGTIPLSCVSINSSIFNLFYADYADGKSFLHSNTYSCNALGVAAALATIRAIRDENIIQQAQELGDFMLQEFRALADASGNIVNVRGIGAVVAGDLVAAQGARLGPKVYENALKRGALIRPIGNTVYWLPPLNTDRDTIKKLAEITYNSIRGL